MSEQFGSRCQAQQYRIGRRDGPNDDVSVNAASGQAAAVGRPRDARDLSGVILPVLLADLQALSE
jgi:hypothetical protein